MLAIAGSDSSGGAGLQCDVKTVSSLGLHAQTVVTALTAQSHERVSSQHHIDPLVVQDQLFSAFSNHTVDAVKSGMLPTQESVKTISAALQRFHASKAHVLDPVLRSTSGTNLVTDSAVQAMLNYLFPLSTVVTPNVMEAEVLSGIEIASQEDAIGAGRKLLEHGSDYVLIKGGHLRKSPGVDILLGPNVHSPPVFFSGFKFEQNREIRGTGCAFASAIACGLASGLLIEEAVRTAKNYITRAIQHASRLENNSWILNHKLAGEERLT